MNKRKRVKLVLNFLENNYKEARCALNYSKPYELLIATRLSAQCTDKRVNSVTKVLFSKYNNIYSLASASFEEIRNIVRPCGFFNKKGQDIVEICRILMEEFNCEVPDSIEELLKLPGVGRKTANLILGEIYKKPAIVVDTHLIRISSRLCLVEEKNPTRIEWILKKIIPKKESLSFCHRVIEFGRDRCKALKPICFDCGLSEICDKGKN